jgi:transposase
MMVRPEHNRTREQKAYLDQLTQSNETIAAVFERAQDFGRLLRKREGQGQLEQWKAAVQVSGIAELIAFVDGLAEDAEAVTNGCSLTWSNGMVEGFINKVKWIKRSSYGQAGFPLLQRRVRLASGSKRCQRTLSRGQAGKPPSPRFRAEEAPTREQLSA